MKGNRNSKIIVDGGANIGCSAVYFANKFPGALVFAVEPEDSNYEMLIRNTSPYSNIRTIKAAIWNKKTFLKICNPEGKKWSFRVKECKKDSVGSVETISIDDLLKKFPGRGIDILKLDIEGAEKQVFQDNPVWLQKVDALMIELHERYSEGCTEVFYEAISEYDYRKYQKGEKVILKRNHKRDMQSGADQVYVLPENP
jgi:FkbM family methyltransferase